MADARRTEDLPVGGQAVIEGVMIRAADRIVTAVRTPSRQIVVREEEHVPWTRRAGVHDVPVARGAVAFLETMVIGLRTLSFSADVAMLSERTGPSATPAEGRSSWKDRAALGATLAGSMAVGLGVFFFLPLAVAQAAGADRGALEFNLVAGALRAAILLGYLWAISHWRDIRRVFEYHGAEHKSIFTLEAGADLTVEQARSFGRLHPRCGTSFLLIVVLLAILVFAVVDSAFPAVFGHAQSLPERFATHLSVLPAVAGASFELLKLSGRKRNHPVTRALIAPGLWLQRITTREPSDDQLEVAMVALRRALGQEAPVAYATWGDWQRESGCRPALASTAAAGSA